MLECLLFFRFAHGIAPIVLAAPVPGNVLYGKRSSRRVTAWGQILYAGTDIQGRTGEKCMSSDRDGCSPRIANSWLFSELDGISLSAFNSEA